MTVNRDTR